MTFQVGDIVQCVDAGPMVRRFISGERVPLGMPSGLRCGQITEVIGTAPCPIGQVVWVDAATSPWSDHPRAMQQYQGSYSADRFRLISRPSPDPIEIEAEEPVPALERRLAHHGQ